MVFILGKHFPDSQLVTKTLTSLYGISGTSAVLATRAPSAATAAAMHPKPNARPDPLANPLSPKRHSLLARLMAQHHIHRTARLGELPEIKLNALTASLTELTIENELRRRVQDDIKRLRDMGSYRGRRHAFGYPVRGQKTKGQIMTAKKLNKVERRG